MFKRITKIFICSFGHPSRPIVRPRKYVTTSSSDIDKVNTSRNDNCGLDQTVDIENDINQIRNGLDINKENEAASINTQDVSPSMVNNCSIQLINPVEQLYSPLNVTGTSEQCSVPQKTYAELLPLKSTSDFNVTMTENTSTFPHFTSSSHVHGSYIF